MPWPTHRTLYELGRGGMGVVELAEVSEGLVAVKRILPYRADDARTRSAFLREARLLARIDHPNVVRALGIDDGGGDRPPALMMHYVAGVPLKELLAASPGGLPVPVAARLGLDVARGLHAAHELCDEAGQRLGVVHRDVSPHNVLVTFQGSAVLLDFGVAKINDATRTLTGEVKGKLAYMAPEQAMADPVDRRSDLYALGAMLYEMLSGRRMHGEGTDLEILKRMVSERPKPLGMLRPEVPEGLARLVERMTNESPERRPATADEVAAALEPFAAGAGGPDVAAQLERCVPGARREHDERVAAARAAAARAGAAGAGGGGLLTTLASRRDELALVPPAGRSVAPPPVLTLPPFVAPLPASPPPAASMLPYDATLPAGSVSPYASPPSGVSTHAVTPPAGVPLPSAAGRASAVPPSSAAAGVSGLPLLSAAMGASGLPPSSTAPGAGVPLAYAATPPAGVPLAYAATPPVGLPLPSAKPLPGVALARAAPPASSLSPRGGSAPRHHDTSTPGAGVAREASPPARVVGARGLALTLAAAGVGLGMFGSAVFLSARGRAPLSASPLPSPRAAFSAPPAPATGADRAPGAGGEGGEGARAPGARAPGAGGESARALGAGGEREASAGASGAGSEREAGAGAASTPPVAVAPTQRRRSRPPPRRPPPPGAGAGAPPRPPPPPLPVDTGAIGGDDR